MKNIATILTLLTLLSVAATSCRKELDIDIKNSERHIVLNGIITPDSLIEVEVSKSKSVLDTSRIEILSDATVSLYKDGSFLEKLSFSDSGYFVSTSTPQINSEYKINVDYKDLTSVYSNVRLSEAPIIDSLSGFLKYRTYEYDEISDTTYEAHFNLKFKDPKNTADYYFLSVSLLSPLEELGEEDDYYRVSYIETRDPALNKENNYFSLSGMSGKVFSDETFNGNAYPLVFWMWHDPNAESAKYVVRLLKVSEDTYNYILSYNLHRISEFNPFSQPVQVLSNVKNGMGLLGGYTITTDTIVLNIQ